MGQDSLNYSQFKCRLVSRQSFYCLVAYTTYYFLRIRVHCITAWSSEFKMFVRDNKLIKVQKVPRNMNYKYTQKG
jgi:hypothetical protein